MTDPELFRSGRQVGDWILEKELGVGGQGCVWRARYARGRRAERSAIKISIARNEQHRERFLSEVSVLATLQHPNIVRVVDFGEQIIENVAYAFYVMPMAECTLAEVHATEQSLIVRLHLLRQVAAALSFMHGRGVLHRDLKPSNILLVRMNRALTAVVADLGLARQQSEQGLLTATREHIGTLGYMAPELLRNELASPASDVYALGQILSFLLTHELPDRENISSRVTESIHQIIARATSYNPDARFQSVAELAGQLPELQIELRSSAREDVPLYPATLSIERKTIRMHKNEGGYTYQHDYSLEVTLRNDGSHTIRNWHVEVEMPRLLLHPSHHYVLMVRNRGTQDRAFLRLNGTEQRPLFPGDSYTLSLDYRVDDGVFEARQTLFAQRVVARAFMENVQVAETSRSVEELQNF